MKKNISKFVKVVFFGLTFTSYSILACAPHTYFVYFYKNCKFDSDGILQENTCTDEAKIERTIYSTSNSGYCALDLFSKGGKDYNTLIQYATTKGFNRIKGPYSYPVTNDAQHPIQNVVLYSNLCKDPSQTEWTSNKDYSEYGPIKDKCGKDVPLQSSTDGQN